MLFLVMSLFTFSKRFSMTSVVTSLLSFQICRCRKSCVVKSIFVWSTNCSYSCFKPDQICVQQFFTQIKIVNVDFDRRKVLNHNRKRAKTAVQITMPMIYALVARGKTVLAEYTTLLGNFQTVTRILLGKIPRDSARMS